MDVEIGIGLLVGRLGTIPFDVRHRAADDLIAALRLDLDGNTTVLVKGSRFMKMERVVDAIAEPKSLTPDSAENKTCS